MTNNTIHNVPRELLAELQEHIHCHHDAVLWGKVCDLLSAPSPAGVGGLEVVAWRIGFPNNAGYKVYEQRQPWAYEQYGVPSVIVYEVQELCRLSDALTQIACLEGEIAKRDEELAACRVSVENCELFRARVAELEDLVISLQCKAIESDDLRAELAAIKAQEPVAWAGAIEYGVPLLMVEPQNWKATPLYAAPVSESKAQGVVQWPDADEIMQMAFEEGQPADDASGYCFELEEFDLFIERLMSEVARLNAAPVQQPKCKTCDDNGRIGGPSFYAPDEGGDPCPDCCATVQQVSVPAWMASSRAFADRLYMAGWRDHADAQHSGVAGMYDELLSSSPAAPAADAELVDALGYQVLFDAIAAATSVYANGAINISVQAFRESLAAHRAQGVV